MRVGIVGTTPRAEAIARLVARSTNEVTVSDPRDASRAAALAEVIPGVKASTPYKQVMRSSIVVLGVPWSDLEHAITLMGPVGDAVVVDAMPPTEADCPHDSGAEVIAHKLDSSRVVETFARPGAPVGSVVPLCGDDPEAKEIVIELIRSCGNRPVDEGPLARAAELEVRTQAA